jgi:hypothetical protein
VFKVGRYILMEYLIQNMDWVDNFGRKLQIIDRVIEMNKYKDSNIIWVIIFHLFIKNSLKKNNINYKDKQQLTNK